MVVELYDEQETLTQMHPALDVVNDTLYVAVQVGVKGKGIQEIVLTSTGEAFTQDEWLIECEKRGLLPTATVHLRDCKPRWNNKAIRELQEGTLIPPTWQEAYNAIYREMDARLQVCDDGYLPVLTLFAMMTYFHPLFDFLPIFHLRGPAESGKSRAGAIVAHIAFNGKMGGSPTPSTIFRRAHGGRYTQVIAEADHLNGLDSGDPFSRQLQSGCCKAEANVEVAESPKGQTFRPEIYFTFNPRVLLSTKHFKSQPLRSRCIKLNIVKIPNADETKLRRSINDDAVWSPLRDMLYRLLLLKWQEVAGARDKLCEDWRGPNAPTGRTFEKWLPLATIASLVSEDVLSEVKRLAMEDMAEQQEDAENTFEAVPFKFAAWLVKDGDTSLSEDELYSKLQDTERGYPTVPEWAIDTKTPVTADQLRQWMNTARKLTKEMKRLNLLPKESTHTRKANIYPLSKESIMGTVEAYLGKFPTTDPTEEDSFFDDIPLD